MLHLNLIICVWHCGMCVYICIYIYIYINFFPSSTWSSSKLGQANSKFVCSSKPHHWTYIWKGTWLDDKIHVGAVAVHVFLVNVCVCKGVWVCGWEKLREREKDISLIQHTWRYRSRQREREQSIHYLLSIWLCCPPCLGICAPPSFSTLGCEAIAIDDSIYYYYNYYYWRVFRVEIQLVISP